MISLLRAEVRRLTSRRLLRILAVAALAITLLVVGRTFLTSHRDSPAELARVEAQNRQNAIRQCEEAQQQAGPGNDFGCAELRSDQYDFSSDRRLIARRALPAGVTGVAIGSALIAFVIGASYVGAEWHAGTMQALLYWEPRRGRVLFAKAVALVVVMVAFMLVLQAIAYAVTLTTGATRGSTEGVTTGLHLSNLLRMTRGAAIVSFAGLLGFAFAGLSRFTGAALGVAFCYFAIIENLIRGLRPGWQRYLVGENVAAVFEKGVRVAPAHARQLVDFGGEEQLYLLSGVRGAVTLAVYLGILLGAFYLTFTRRDVT